MNENDGPVVVDGFHDMSVVERGIERGMCPMRKKMGGAPTVFVISRKHDWHESNMRRS